jgi:hypothetical protein
MRCHLRAYPGQRSFGKFLHETSDKGPLKPAAFAITQKQSADDQGFGCLVC